MSSRVPTDPETGRSVLSRTLSILDAFEYRDRDVALTTLAHRTGLPKATVFRIVNELVRWGALERVEHGYQLGVRLFMLGEKVPRQGSLRDIALPYLEDLYEATHENVNLAVLHGTDVLFLARVTGHRSSDVLLRVGDTLPAHSTSTGKALLAYAPRHAVRRVIDAGLPRLAPNTVVMPGMLQRQLRTVASRGYAVNIEETHRGIVSVAAPIFGTDRAAIAAVSITGVAGRVNVHRLAPAVRTATLALSRVIATEDARMRADRQR
ncbi:MAG: IclR family transcriptional regulator [Streptosporangiaceae bacterium]